MSSAQPLRSVLAARLKPSNRQTPDVEHVSRSDPDAPVEPRDGEVNCPTCGNKRFILDAAGGLKPCPDCNVAQRWKVQALAAFASRSKLTQQQTFLNFRTTFNGQENPVLVQCLRAAERFAAQPEGRWLVIWGERGSGKSHLCAAVDNHLTQAGIPSLFITVPDLLAALRQAIDLQSNTEQESFTGRMNIFKTATVLILDDLGAEQSSPWSESVLFEILDYRYRNRLATMIATNVHPDEFDPRIASRMQDTALCTVIENAALDYRRRPLSEKR